MIRFRIYAAFYGARTVTARWRGRPHAVVLTVGGCKQVPGLELVRVYRRPQTEARTAICTRAFRLSLADPIPII